MNYARRYDAIGLERPAPFRILKSVDSVVWPQRIRREAPVSTAPVAFRYRPSVPDYVELFGILVKKWRAETLTMSLADEMVKSDSFRAITAMGEKALPLIYRQLRERPSMLVLAGIVISKENPVPEAAIGRLDLIVSAWLRWAESNGAAN